MFPGLCMLLFPSVLCTQNPPSVDQIVLCSASEKIKSNSRQDSLKPIHFLWVASMIAMSFIYYEHSMKTGSLYTSRMKLTLSLPGFWKKKTITQLSLLVTGDLTPSSIFDWYLPLKVWNTLSTETNLRQTSKPVDGKKKSLNGQRTYQIYIYIYILNFNQYISIKSVSILNIMLIFQLVSQLSCLNKSEISKHNDND